jgi:hypothetical protein
MDDKDQQIDEMGESREAQYALECVLVRLTEAELQRVVDDLPPRAREHIRATTAHKMRHLGEQHPDWPGRGSTGSRPLYCPWPRFLLLLFGAAFALRPP